MRTAVELLIQEFDRFKSANRINLDAGTSVAVNPEIKKRLLVRLDAYDEAISNASVQDREFHFDKQGKLRDVLTIGRVKNPYLTWSSVTEELHGWLGE